MPSDRSFAQSLMESGAVVRLYEGWLGRRSPIFSLVLGISLERELRLVREVAGLRGDEAVLDLACGSGVHARNLAAASPSGRTLGVDLSRAMLRYAAGRAGDPGAGLLFYVRGDAFALPLGAAGFDLVNFYGALHLVPNVEGVLAEVARVLAPGGQFIVGTFRRGPGALHDLRVAVLRRLGIRPFAREELADLLRAAGFRDIATHHERARYLIMSGIRDRPTH